MFGTLTSLPMSGCDTEFWTTVKDATGMVDLIISPASEEERSRLEDAAPDWAVMDSYGKEQDLKFSIPVPEMRQSIGFCEVVAGKALAAMEKLTGFFIRLEMRRPQRRL